MNEQESQEAFQKALVYPHTTIQTDLASLEQRLRNVHGDNEGADLAHSILEQYLLKRTHMQALYVVIENMANQLGRVGLN